MENNQSKTVWKQPWWQWNSHDGNERPILIMEVKNALVPFQHYEEEEEEVMMVIVTGL